MLMYLSCSLRTACFFLHFHSPVLILMSIYAQDHGAGKYLSQEDLDSGKPNLKICDPNYYSTLNYEILVLSLDLFLPKSSL